MIFRAFDISGSALTAQRLRLNVIANNLANMDTHSTATRPAYRRLLVQFAPRPGGSFGDGVMVTGIVADPSALKPVYEPGNPNANAQGYVYYPNVNPVKEMTDLVSASRSYEANVTATTDEKAVDGTILGVLRA
ncbi:MAG: flagellar basal body rod protein FlgC [Thermaerobacter sp.]|jgi:flagellar basal-body rod protein FlgC|nr:flagellar basal body rod protein FlgC [Thermaerobacter sp.]MDA8146739.1 flagellar basal body rod protein FlgC [Thermaerobacter sp.]